MRFTSASFMVLFGLVAASCAAPLSSDYDVRDAERYEARDLDNSFFPRSEFESENLESRAGGKSVKFENVDYSKELAITYDTPKLRTSEAIPPAEQVNKMAEDFLAEVAILDLHKPKFKFTNQWKGRPSLIMFKFSLPVCKGDCHAEVFRDGRAQLTDGEGKVIYTAKATAHSKPLEDKDPHEDGSTKASSNSQNGSAAGAPKI